MLILAIGAAAIMAGTIPNPFNLRFVTGLVLLCFALQILSYHFAFAERVRKDEDEKERSQDRGVSSGLVR